MVFIIVFMFPVLAFADVERCEFTERRNQMMNFGNNGITMMFIIRPPGWKYFLKSRGK